MSRLDVGTGLGVENNFDGPEMSEEQVDRAVASLTTREIALLNHCKEVLCQQSTEFEREIRIGIFWG